MDGCPDSRLGIKLENRSQNRSLSRGIRDFGDNPPRRMGRKNVASCFKFEGCGQAGVGTEIRVVGR